MAIKQTEITKKKITPEPSNSPRAKSVCKSCGAVFKQDWNGESAKYSEFKLCPSCRANGIDNVSKKEIKLEYEPHKFQRLVHQSKARFKIIAAGARGGKDYCCVVEFFNYLIRCANEERPKTMIPKVMGWIIAPTETVARQNWRDLKRVIPKDLIADESRSTGQITLLNGILIELHSAYDPESLVAVALDAVLITEAARIKDLEIVWDNLEMRLNSPHKGINGHGGMGLINSSPLGKNYFYKMFCMGNHNHPAYDPDFQSFHWSTWDNPYMAEKGNEVKSNGRTYKENMRRRMSDTRYRQDILAEFLSDKASVFPTIRECLEKMPEFKTDEERKSYIEEWRSPKPYNSYRMGYDPATGGGDDPILWVVEDDTGKVMTTVNMSGLGWEAQFNRVEIYSQRYNNAPVILGITGHTTVQSQLEKRGIAVIPQNEQGHNKSDLVENLAVVVENRQLIILDDGTDETEYLLNEFEDYVRDRRGTTVTFHNGSSDKGDDHVSAAYFAFAPVSQIGDVLAFDGLIAGV